jgi:hypothetical protein
VNPNFAVTNFGMGDRAINSVLSFPTFMHEQVMIAIATYH